jgi:glycerate 2-kinase
MVIFIFGIYTCILPVNQNMADYMNPEERKRVLLSVIKESLEDLRPELAIRRNLTYDTDTKNLKVARETVSLHENEKVWIIGAGKAAVTMAAEAANILGSRLGEGMVIAPDKPDFKLNRVQVLKGSHPIPDKESLSSTYELLQFTKSIPENAPVLCLISGGASALLCMPVDQVEISELGLLHQMLLESGMDIHEMNTVRKVMSKVKAGGLLRFLEHTRLYDLVISDVPGDNLGSIGSGPMTYEKKQYDNAFQLLKRFDLWNRVPHSVRTVIARGMHEPSEEIEPAPVYHSSVIISSAEKLAEQVAKNLKGRNFETDVIRPAYNDSIENVEQLIVNKLDALRNNDMKSDGMPANDGKYRSLVFYGESSVNVTGDGKGGRNQELALRIALHINGSLPVSFASIGTDGIDGPTDAAGAIVDETTIPEAKEQHLDPETFLKQNDSYSFFAKAGGHIITGPTGNNLMDLQVLLAGG